LVDLDHPLAPASDGAAKALSAPGTPARGAAGPSLSDW
jgi:hypothetical protein